MSTSAPALSNDILQDRGRCDKTASPLQAGQPSARLYMPGPDHTRDFTNGVRIVELERSGLLAGRAGEDDVVLVRHDGGICAIGAHCTHYGGPLADGLVVDGTIRCPWHHACFSLTTGEAVRAPAFDPLPRWRVVRDGDVVRVAGREAEPARGRARAAGARVPASVVIVGGGAAGHAAADALRREGYDGPVTLLTASSTPPIDRPALSKEYLAGDVGDGKLALRPPEWYDERDVKVVLGARVSWIDLSGRAVRVAGDDRYPFEALVLATGAEPVRLPVAGGTLPHVHYLRSAGDSRAIIAGAAAAQRAVVIGASFIGLEVAASLRTRGLAVDVVSRESRPMERVLGPRVGRFVQGLHESHGVGFHLGRTVAAVEARRVTLDDGSSLDADLVVAGVGVEPRVELARQAHLAVDRGVVVNEYLETRAPGVYAAGDIVQWPDPHSGQRIRVEHWVVAERQGATVARNILGRQERFTAVPFFWSQHYDVAINYLGHADSWDTVQIDGDLDARNCTITYRRHARRLAVATIGRDRESLETEAEMERLI